jgi:hypothetical protein
VDAARAFLVALLGLDCLQLGVSLLAVAHGRRRRLRDEHQLARYSFGHARLLAAGAVVLALPLVLGLARVIGSWTALWVVVSVEVLVAVAASGLLGRMHRAAQSG